MLLPSGPGLLAQLLLLLHRRAPSAPRPAAGGCVALLQSSNQPVHAWDALPPCHVPPLAPTTVCPAGLPCAPFLPPPPGPSGLPGAPPPTAAGRKCCLPCATWWQLPSSCAPSWWAPAARLPRPASLQAPSKAAPPVAWPAPAPAARCDELPHAARHAAHARPCPALLTASGCDTPLRLL